MTDFSQMLDEDLQAIANGGGNAAPTPAPSTPDFSSMSDEDLQKLAGSDQKPSDAEDVGKTLIGNVAPNAAANTAANLVSIPATVGSYAAQIGTKGGEYLGEGVDELQRMARGQPIKTQADYDSEQKDLMNAIRNQIGLSPANSGDISGLVPTPSNLLNAGMNAMGTPLYQPKTEAGKQTETFGNIATAGAGSGIKVLPAFMGAAGATGGGEAAKQLGGTQAEQYLASLAGGIGGGKLGETPSPEATPLSNIEDQNTVALMPNRPFQGYVPDADRAALAQKAMDEHNIPIAVSQLTPADQGKFTKGLASAASEVPFNQASAFGKQQRAAYNGALAKTFGEDTSDNAGKIMPDDLASAHTRIGKMFDDAFAGKQIPINQDFLERINDILDDADNSSTSANLVHKNADLLVSKIGDDGTISGDYLNNLRSRYGRASSLQNDAAPFIKQLRDSVMTLADDPVAREQYKNLKIIEPLAAKSPDGYVQPSMLNNRLIASRYFPDYEQGGGGKLGDLARIGNTFLKDTVPNSGTAFRSKINQLIYEAPAAIATIGATGSPYGVAGALTAIPIARGVTALNNSQGIVRGLVNRALEGSAPKIAEEIPAVTAPPQETSYQNMPISSPEGQAAFMKDIQNPGIALDADHAAADSEFNNDLKDERPYFQNQYATGAKNAAIGKNKRVKANTGKNVQSNE